MLLLPFNLIFALLSIGNPETEKPQKSEKLPVKIGHLPPTVTESSGLEQAGNGNLYTHNDAGNEPILYKVSATGKLILAIPIPDATNNDWEDITKDDNGNIYIGDMGNNSSKRTNLRIYKTQIDKDIKVSEINFKYEDQKKTKDSGKQKVTNFDCEAMFWHGGKIYLISKDRSQHKIAKVYEIPDQPGTYQAKLIGSQKFDIMITSADISPDGKKIALIGHGKLLIFNVNGSVGSFIKTKPTEHTLAGTGQIEGVVFTDNNSVVFSNEGGILYRYDL